MKLTSNPNAAYNLSKSPPSKDDLSDGIKPRLKGRIGGATDNKRGHLKARIKMSAVCRPEATNPETPRPTLAPYDGLPNIRNITGAKIFKWVLTYFRKWGRTLSSLCSYSHAVGTLDILAGLRETILLPYAPTRCPPSLQTPTYYLHSTLDPIVLAKWKTCQRKWRRIGWRMGRNKGGG